MCLRISSLGPSIAKQTGRLFNPDAGPIPLCRIVETEPLSKNGSSYVARTPSASRPSALPHGAGNQARTLFDHRRDDPLRFAMLPRVSGAPPTPPSGGKSLQLSHRSSDDYASVSSNSLSSPHAVSSSAFTLNSSTQLYLFSGPPVSGKWGAQEEGFVLAQLKVCRRICDLESL